MVSALIPVLSDRKNTGVAVGVNDCVMPMLVSPIVLAGPDLERPVRRVRRLAGGALAARRRPIVGG